MAHRTTAPRMNIRQARRPGHIRCAVPFAQAATGPYRCMKIPPCVRSFRFTWIGDRCRDLFAEGLACDPRCADSVEKLHACVEHHFLRSILRTFFRRDGDVHHKQADQGVTLGLRLLQAYDPARSLHVRWPESSGPAEGPNYLVRKLNQAEVSRFPVEDGRRSRNSSEGLELKDGTSPGGRRIHRDHHIRPTQSMCVIVNSGTRRFQRTAMRVQFRFPATDMRERRHILNSGAPSD